MGTTFSLRVVGGNSSRRFDLQPGDISQVGRAVESNILIPDPNISRHQLTVWVREDRIDVEMNPQSSNQLVKNGHVVATTSLVPGEFFDIGPYRFELEATAELPVAAAGLLPPDPAGAIDVKLADELQRIAPRWSTVEKAGAATSAGAAATAEGPLRRLLLPLAAVVVAALVAWEYLGVTPPKAPDDSAVAAANLDLLGSVAPPNCHGGEACLNQAREFYKLAEKMREGGSRDLITLYRIAKQLHRARLALNGKEEQLPELQNRYRRARSELTTAFTDVQFRFERARSEGDLNRQLAALQAVLALCEEDRLPICTDRERTYQQLREQQQTMR